MRVLVTRPQPGAARTARKLAGLGFDVVELPLTEIVAIDVLENMVAAASTRPVDVVAITSANAIRHAPPDLLASITGVACYAVGSETAAQARAAGFQDVRNASGSADELAETIISEATPVTKILYLCGRVRLSSFEIRLAEAGFTVYVIETYDSLPIAYTPATLSQILGTEPISAVLLYSAGAAELFSTMAATEAWIGNESFLCLSPRVAERLSGVDASRIRVATEPTEEALLALL